MSKLIGFSPLIALTVFLGANLANAGAQERLRHPRLHAALSELYEARQELRGARERDPQRDRALAALDEAIGALKLILQVKGDNFRPIDRDPDRYKAYKDHPKLRRALHDLREARDELRGARADFGNLKERAEDDIDYAIGQILVILRRERH